MSPVDIAMPSLMALHFKQVNHHQIIGGIIVNPNTLKPNATQHAFPISLSPLVALQPFLQSIAGKDCLIQFQKTIPF